MKKFSIFLMIVCSLALHAGNILKNSDFSDGMKFWSIAGWTRSKGEVQVQNGVMSITQAKFDQYTLAQQHFKLKPNTEYELTFRMKAENIVPDGKRGAGAAVLILLRGKTVAEICPDGKWKRANGSFDWKNCSVKFLSGDCGGADFSVYPMMYHAVGKALFDDFAVREVPQKKAAPLKVTFYPAKFQNEQIHLVPSFPVTLFAELFGKRADAADLVLELDLPQGIELTAASPYHHQDGKFIAEKIEKSAVARDGKPYTRNIISISNPVTMRMTPDKLAWNNYERIFLEAAPGAEEGKAYYRVRSAAVPAQGEGVLHLKVLPPLKSIRPMAKFGFFISYLFSMTVPNERVRNTYMNYFLELAKRPGTFRLFHHDQLEPEQQQELTKKFDTIVFIGAQSCTPLGPIAKFRKDKNFDGHRQVRDNGQVLDSVCASYLAQTPDSPIWQDYLISIIRDRMKNLKTDAICWDVEPMWSCYCEACCKLFCAENKLPLLSSKEIQSKHADAYFKFRVETNAKVINNFAAAVRKHFPKIPVMLCTDNLHAGANPVAAWCGVDARKSDRHFDRMMNMPYYEGLSYYDDVHFNMKSLKTPQLMLNDPSENMELFYNRYSPRGVLMNMVATAALGAEGYGVWPSDALDGRYLHALREGADLIARVEDYYQTPGRDIKLRALNVRKISIPDGKRIVEAELPDFAKSTRAREHRLNGSTLLTIFNYNKDHELIFEAPAPQKGIQAFDAATNRMYQSNGKAFPVVLAPGSVSAIAYKAEKASRDGVIELAVAEKKLAEFRAKSHTSGELQARKGADSSVAWGLLPGSQGAYPVMKRNGVSVTLDPSANGAVRSLSVNGKDLLDGKDRGKLDELMFHDFPGVHAFAATRFELKDNTPVVTMKFVMPPPLNAAPGVLSLADLEVIKEVRLEKDALHSFYTLTNRSNRTMPISIRLRHYPRLGGIAWNLTMPNWKHDGKRGEYLLLAPGARDKIGPLKGTILSEQYDGKALRAASGRDALDFAVTPKEGAGVFYWYNPSGPSTVEPVIRSRTLKPGESFRFDSRVGF